MAYTLKKDHLKNWDLPKSNEKPIFTLDNDEDDQDIYISERSSVASSNDFNQVSHTTLKRLPTPGKPQLPILPQKQSHSLRYPYNELPQNGVPLATQFHLRQKEEKQKKKSLRKAPPGQGSLLPFPDAKQSEMGEHYHPYWYYYKVKNPDWITRQRQTSDGYVVPYESIDPAEYAHPPALTATSIKPKQHQPRKSRPNDIPTIPLNPDKSRHDHIEKTSSSSLQITSQQNHDNSRQQQTGPTSKRYIPSKNGDDNSEHKRIMSQQRRKLQTDTDWNDHYQQSLNTKSPYESASLTLASSSFTTRSKYRPKISDKSPLTSDADANGKHRYHHHHQSNQSHANIAPSIPSPPNHHHHHHHQQHVRRRPPSGAYIGSELQVVDISFKKLDRSVHFQQVQHPSHPPSPLIHQQNPYFPPIIRDHQSHQKTNTPRFPSEYYGTLARQTRDNAWEGPMDLPKIYKPDPQTRFYDRYLNNTIDKRLAV